jgi:thiol-disulfide isomerase/thioredoxin
MMGGLKNSHFALFLFAIFLVTIVAPVLAQEENVTVHNVTAYLFYGKYCPHCAKERVFLESLESKYPQLEVKEYEASYNEENAKLFKEIAEAYGITSSYVPTLFMGDFEPIVGYLNDETTGKQIEEQVEYCLEEGCIDPVDKVNGGPSQNQTQVVELPFFGKIDVSQTGLLTFTIMIGVLDGFNPCAMWVLVFLLSMLLAAGSRKRILIIGGAFLLVSGLVYFMFMVAWLNLFMFLGYLQILSYAVGALAIAFGILNIKDYFSQKICRISIPGAKNFNIFGKMKKVVSLEVPLYVTVAWIMFFAIGVNFVELVCTAGFPAIYTKILAMQDLSSIAYYGYLLVYMFFYMIDDLIIFSIVVYTMSSEKFTQKYGKAAKFISGLVILILGIIIIIDPSLLMFSY